MYQYKTLVFTGKSAGKKPDRETKEGLMGLPKFWYLSDPNFRYLGSINYDRTIAATVIELCHRHSNCNAHEVYETIQFYTRELLESRAKYKEFPEDDDFEFMTLEQVKQHLNSVVYRSTQGYSKYIPHNIQRVPNTAYFMLERR